MRFTCATHNLTRALGIAERFAGRNITLPILANVLIEWENSALRIAATNLEYAAEIHVPGKSTAPGRVSVPARTLYSLVQSIKEEKLDIEIHNQNLVVKTESRNTRINGMSVDEFPILPKIAETRSFSVPAASLSNAIKKVASAASQSEFKPELAGIFFSVGKDAVHFAATDTFRLAEYSFLFPEKTKEEQFSFILPHRAAQEAGRVFEGAEGEVIVSIGENQALFEGNGVRILSRLVDGAFPAYTGIIPKNFETTCYISRDEMIRAVRASSIFASKLQEVTLRFSGNTLEVTAMNPEVGEYNTRLAVQKTGKDLAISFNYHYFLDGLNALDEEEFCMGLNNENAPSLLKNKEDAPFLYVVMPIRTT